MLCVANVLLALPSYDLLDEGTQFADHGSEVSLTSVDSRKLAATDKEVILGLEACEGACVMVAEYEQLLELLKCSRYSSVVPLEYRSYRRSFAVRFHESSLVSLPIHISFAHEFEVVLVVNGAVHVEMKVRQLARLIGHGTESIRATKQAGHLCA